ncbi:MAG TPA: sulfocyanin-like copper-binding protein [Gemmatimonadales bacterium]|nr:sulfocyanin-like copper-binding protein [Gemmatimonadales bacterium]
MTFRTVFDAPSLAVLLAGSLGAAGLLGCTSRTPDTEAAAAPAPSSDTARATAHDTAMVSTAATVAETTGEPSAPARQASTGSPASAAADSQWVQWDPATKTVTFRLVAGPFDWNGYKGGDATLTVPPASNNVMNFEQNDGTPHSAEISTGTGPVPNSGGDPAIPRAYTNKVVEGLPQGAKDVMKFTAPDSGTFRLICGVPGHALSGMWIWFKVDPAATTPTFGPTPK